MSVGIKLSVIAGMLAALIWYFVGLSREGPLHFAAPQVAPVRGIMQAFGLLVTVQGGGETSRYLGAAYDMGSGVRSMRLAQAVSTVIYLLYITLSCYLFMPNSGPLAARGWIFGAGGVGIDADVGVQRVRDHQLCVAGLSAVLWLSGGKATLFGALAVLGVLVALFGAAIE